MTRILTNHIATMTEMREPQKVLDRAGGKPVAILKNSQIAAYFVPLAYVENANIDTMEGLIAALREPEVGIPKPRLSDKLISKAVSEHRSVDRYHEHPDCVRIAYEFLDAQKTLKNTGTGLIPLKHRIEQWAGRYVSTFDVEVAAKLHPDIEGEYPTFNISKKLVEPDLLRLRGISEKMRHLSYRERHDRNNYSSAENLPDNFGKV